MTTIRVEVAFAESARQFLRQIELPVGATVAEALRASGVEAEMDVDAARLEVGIWSRTVSRDRVLANGDRVELYRPLRIDPKEARRRRAGRTAGR